jgi:hypothetical protein
MAAASSSSDGGESSTLRVGHNLVSMLATLVRA